MPKVTDPQPAINTLTQCGWSLVSSLKGISNGFVATAMDGTTHRIQFIGQNRSKKEGGHYFIGIHHKYFALIDDIVFWADGEQVKLVIPTSFLASIFNPKRASIGTANRWYVRVYFDRAGRSELIPNKYRQTYDVSMYRLSSTPRQESEQTESTPLIGQQQEQIGDLSNPCPLTPDALKRIQRILKHFERPSAITRHVKRTRGFSCQLCGELGFVQRNGKRYCEVHHLFHLSKNPPPDCLAPKYLVVLCATCHRRLHYAKVGEPARKENGWQISVDDQDVFFQVADW